jgi:CheY-like chemotaxis protein
MIAMTQDGTPLDPDEIMAQAVRGIAGEFGHAHPGWLYDSRLPPVRAFGDRAALTSDLHRLLHAATRLRDGGLLMVEASGAVQRDSLHWQVRVAGTHVTRDESRLASGLERLGLQACAAHPWAPLRRAQARLRSGAAIEFAARMHQGWLLKFDLVLSIAGDLGASSHGTTPQARAWVIDGDEAAGQILAHRLQRIGWSTLHFRSVRQARCQLQALSGEQARPALVIGTESDTVDGSDLSLLQAELPGASVVVLGVTSGSPSLAAPSSLDIHALPFGNGDLHRLTHRGAAVAQPGSGTTEPVPLELEHRPAMVVVDDDEVSRTLLCGLGHSLGFEVHAVPDGPQALQVCMHRPFDAALVDYSMPHINGVDLTRRLRDLQDQGLVSPFPIVGASADADAEVQQRWQAAGAAAFLRKPLSRDEMLRVLTRLHVHLGDRAR